MYTHIDVYVCVQHLGSSCLSMFYFTLSKDGKGEEWGMEEGFPLTIYIKEF